MKKVLIIEDDKSMRETIKDIIEDDWYKIYQAENGQEGLLLQKQEKFDLVITDILMPEIDGMEVIMEIKTKYPGTKVMAISGGGYVSSDDYLYMARQLGSHNIIAKPFDNDELKQKIITLLNGPIEEIGNGV